MSMNAQEKIELLKYVLLNKIPDGKKQLIPTSKKSPQPVALMRLPIFIPSRHRSLAAPEITKDEFPAEEFFETEGYASVKIVGPALNMEFDFKVWTGIILAFYKYDTGSHRVTLKFSEFIRLCGFPGSRINHIFRKHIDDSLIRIRSKTLRFSRNGKELNDGYVTGLLQVADWNIKTDEITLVHDEKLIGLYAYDYRVLINLAIILQLPRKEVAQAIYTFLAALPTDPAPVSFERLRERLKMLCAPKEQNRQIKKALEELRAIGYLDYSLVNKPHKTETYVQIHARREPKIK